MRVDSVETAPHSTHAKYAMPALFPLSWLIGLVSLATPVASPSVLLISGQNNHDWERTVPHLQAALEATEQFEVTVLLSPEKGADSTAWANWRPQFDAYDVVLLAYNGDLWPHAVRQEFETYVAGGGAALIQHAANNPFGGWEAFEQMVGLLWRGADAGHAAFWDDGLGLTRIPPGEDRGAGHGRLHDWQITVRDLDHPITAGMPPIWLHPHDELYHAQRGPADGLNVLATAWSDPESGGTGRHELMVWWTAFGEGRVLTLLPGHLWGGQEDDRALRCVGFRTLLQRSVEWLATGEVTIPVPENFPTETRAVVIAPD